MPQQRELPAEKAQGNHRGRPGRKGRNRRSHKRGNGAPRYVQPRPQRDPLVESCDYHNLSANMAFPYRKEMVTVPRYGDRLVYFCDYCDQPAQLDLESWAEVLRRGPRPVLSDCCRRELRYDYARRVRLPIDTQQLQLWPLAWYRLTVGHSRSGTTDVVYWDDPEYGRTEVFGCLPRDGSNNRLARLTGRQLLYRKESSEKDEEHLSWHPAEAVHKSPPRERKPQPKDKVPVVRADGVRPNGPYYWHAANGSPPPSPKSAKHPKSRPREPQLYDYLPPANRAKAKVQPPDNASPRGAPVEGDFPPLDSSRNAQLARVPIPPKLNVGRRGSPPGPAQTIWFQEARFAPPLVPPVPPPRDPVMVEEVNEPVEAVPQPQRDEVPQQQPAPNQDGVAPNPGPLPPDPGFPAPDPPVAEPPQEAAPPPPPPVVPVVPVEGVEPDQELLAHIKTFLLAKERTLEVLRDAKHAAIAWTTRQEPPWREQRRHLQVITCLSIAWSSHVNRDLLNVISSNDALEAMRDANDFVNQGKMRQFLSDRVRRAFWHLFGAPDAPYTMPKK